MTLLFAIAQAAIAVASPDQAATQGVISYPPAFFAASRPSNASEMIEKLPGFAFDGGNGVRGYEGAAGNVLIDGQRPASKTDSLEDILRRLPASKVARIELVRGGAPGIDMQGKSIIANVVLKSDAGFNGLFGIADDGVPKTGANTWFTRLEGSGTGNGRNWEAGFSGGGFTDDSVGDGPRVRVDPTGGLLIRSKVQSEAGGTQLRLTGAYELPLFDGKLRANAKLQKESYDSDETTRSVFPAPSLLRDHQRDNSFQSEFGLRYSRDFGPKLKLELVGLHQAKSDKFNDRVVQPGDLADFSQNSDTAESIGRGVLKYTQTTDLSWEVGGEYALNTLENRIQFLDNGVLIAIPAANVRVEEKRWEVFGKSTWRPLPKWTLEASLRQEGSTISSAGDVRLEKTLGFTKPRVSLTWALDDKTQLRARFERTVGQLDFNDFTATSSLNTGVLTAGNPNLTPEQAWVSEAAFERRFLGAGAAVLTFRHSALTDVIDRAPVFIGTSAFDSPANIGEGTKDELILDLTLPFDKIGLKGAQLRGQSTWRHSEVTDPTTHGKREISGLRPQEWEAHFSWDLPQHNLSWGVDAYGAWRRTYYKSDEVEIRKLKTFVNPFIEWKPRADWSLRVELPNLTARGFRNTRYIYGGPRNLNALAFVEDRDLKNYQGFHIRLRKTFG